MPISDSSKKKCKVCLLIKPISEFRKYRNTCKKCEHKQLAQYRKAARLRKKQEKEDNYRFLDFYKKVKGG